MSPSYGALHSFTNTSVRVLALTLFVFPPLSFAQATPRNSTGPVAPALLLEDGTPVKIRIARTVSSADAHVGDTVDFEVLEEVRLGNLLVIPKGGVAWATVTAAQSKRRMARGGKLDMNIDSVRLIDGEKVALRAVKEVKGGGHTGAMTGAMVGTAIVFFPAAPLFLFMHGKDITIPKGTEVTAYINGNFPVDAAKFQGGGPAIQAASAAVAASGTATLDISSTPPNADIEVDGSFIGNTPSSFGLAGGEHTVKITKSGYKPWERKIRTSTGAVRLAAELEAGNPVSVPATISAPRTIEPDRGSPALVKTAAPAATVQAKTRDSSESAPVAPVRESDRTAGHGNATPTVVLSGGESSTAGSDVGKTASHTGGSDSSLVSLGIRAQTTDVAGAKISEIAKGSIADHAGLHVGDIINSVDAKPVNTPMELAAELQNRAPGTKIRLGYLYHTAVVGDIEKEAIIIAQ